PPSWLAEHQTTRIRVSRYPEKPPGDQIMATTFQWSLLASPLSQPISKTSLEAERWAMPMVTSSDISGEHRLPPLTSQVWPHYFVAAIPLSPPRRFEVLSNGLHGRLVDSSILNSRLNPMGHGMSRWDMALLMRTAP